MLKKLKNKLVQGTESICMAGLAPIEKILLERLKKPNDPVIFIIGAPRSGTSLLYEILVRRYKFSYISNLAQKFNETPVAATKLGIKIINKWHQQSKDSYNSNYGNINGWGAPSEGGMIWNRWFPENHYLDGTSIENFNSSLVQKTIYGLAAAMNGPFINKNVMHSVHIRLLNILFPDCLFIHITRDIKSNVRSILRAHAKFSTDKDEWFSVKPREYEKYKNEDIILRSVIQVHYVHQNIHEDAELIGKNRFYTVAYEDICQNSEAALNAIYVYLNKNGVEVRKRDIALPKLLLSSTNKFDAHTEQKIQYYLQDINQ